MVDQLLSQPNAQRICGGRSRRREQMNTQSQLQSIQLKTVEIPLSTGGTRLFFYRETSSTDLWVIEQIFEAEHYNFKLQPMGHRFWSLMRAPSSVQAASISHN